MNKRLDDNGHEILDSTPVAMPVKFRRTESLVETVQRLVAGEFSRVAAQAGYESFAEADDFNVGDDYDPRSPYELEDGQLEYDIRDDARYKKRDAAEARIAEEGVGEGEQSVQRGGQQEDKDSEGAQSDK